ncbi:hypothetical protein SAY87_012113 [Trapa incisa]|uniref:Uncharacterized protein n=1 Tax=Trapa incisa TaxID=236973 RepID=A0AAN7GKC6_9MYRT|nr:hypothetical protein SAY87_012113 [Trapa incisa]
MSQAWAGFNENSFGRLNKSLYFCKFSFHVSASAGSRGFTSSSMLLLLFGILTSGLVSCSGLSWKTCFSPGGDKNSWFEGGPAGFRRVS